MAELIGLKDFKKKAVVKTFCRSVSGHLNELKKRRFATSANDFGAINVWKDDNGIYRGERYNNCVKKSVCETRNLATLKRWLQQNYYMIVNGARSPLYR